MIPILYEANYDIYRYTGVGRSLGKGKLVDIISCVIHETLSGEYELEMKYPITAPLAQDLMGGGTIYALNGAYQRSANAIGSTWSLGEAFDIYSWSESLDGVLTIKARHVIYRLARSTVRTFDYGSGGLGTAINDVYDFSTPAITYPEAPPLNSGNLRIKVDTPNTTLAQIYAFAKIAGGEISCNLDRLHTYHRGDDLGDSVRFGVNLTSLERTTDDTGTFNAVVPYWDDGNGNITYASGYVVQPTTPISPVIAVPLDLSSEFSTTPTSAQLVTAARDYLDTNTPWLPSDTIDVDMATVGDEEIELGDTIRVYAEKYGINTKMRIVEYEFDVLTQSYISLKVGTPETEFVAVTGDAASGSGGGGTSLNGLSYSTDGLTFSSGTILDGGYCKIGNLVIVNMRINVTTTIPAGNTFMTGFPRALSTLGDTTGFVAFASSNPNISVSMRVNGTLINGGSGTSMSGAYMLSGTYLCA